MSEYATSDAADRFLGSPTTGPADWIQNIRQQPFTVLLLDEIEKASPESSTSSWASSTKAA